MENKLIRKLIKENVEILELLAPWLCEIYQGQRSRVFNENVHLNISFIYLVKF